jgi:hypothetical protein
MERRSSSLFPAALISRLDSEIEKAVRTKAAAKASGHCGDALGD